MSFSAEVSGYLTFDAKHAVKADYKQTTFSIRTHKASKGGEFETIFIDCICFGNIAEKHMNLEKGAHVLVRGPFWTKSYQGRDGTIKSGYSLKVESLHLLASREAENVTPREEPALQTEPSAFDSELTNIPF